MCECGQPNPDRSAHGCVRCREIDGRRTVVQLGNGTVCSRGHEKTVIRADGHRACLECRRLYQQERSARERAS